MQDVERGIAWLKANGIEHVRGHNLVWGSRQYLPQQVYALSKDEQIKAIQQRVRGTVTRFRGKLYVWDVVNEAATNTELWDKIGWQHFADTYKWARAADAKVLLAYNDYNITNESGGSGHRQKVKERIQYLLDHGAPLDVIGDQAHMGKPLTPIQRVLEITDEMARFGKRIEITEFDASIPDDRVHGQYVRDFMIAMFSHPAVDGFVMWGFWEGAHWLAAEGGAMFRKDWSKRPAQQAYENLVLKQWWTRAALTTDGRGRAGTRAFYGTHTVTVEKDGKKSMREWKLLPDAKTPELVVQLPR